MIINVLRFISTILFCSVYCAFALLLFLMLLFYGINHFLLLFSLHQVTYYTSRCCCFSVTQSCLTLQPHGLQHAKPSCPSPSPGVSPSSCSLHSDAVQLSHPLMPSSPSAFDLSQHQGIFQWVVCLHQMTKILELQFQHQSIQWVFRVNFLQTWQVWSSCCPRNSQESSPASQFEGNKFFGTLPSLWFSSHTHKWPTRRS